MIEFIDTHVHFIDQKDPNLRFSWLEPEFVHPRLGDIDDMKHLTWKPEGLKAEARFTGLTKVVNVQAALDSEDPVAETAFLQAAADRTGWPNGIVAYVDLAADDAAEQLDRHMAYANLRGIRDFGRRPDGDFFADDAWRRGAALLPERSLVLDIDVQAVDMAKARDAADALGDVTFILEHAAVPMERTDGFFEIWSDALDLLAGAPNTYIKVSGLGMGDPEWTVDSLRPWVHRCFDAFGIERCLFGTNWPVDRLYSGYRDVVEAYASITADLTEAERRRFFVGTAEELYRI
ncbi:MAG TPA: amidohydrolase family protein [Baekduia sp.]|uniref:amidohydrolase family protein n=1 Tax=Baekduia sp. TaxID=2600305 RepID=UPI002D76DE1F|nr:amidohydrolase family protein [Baekduia sp.]HET6507995.1 amidohydrolase family protein [Baekduia sp.]